MGEMCNMDRIVQHAFLIEIEWALVFIMVAGFLLGFGSFIGRWLRDVRERTTRALDDTEGTYDETEYEAELKRRREVAP
jgi:hypothetical protein